MLVYGLLVCFFGDSLTSLNIITAMRAQKTSLFDAGYGVDGCHVLACVMFAFVTSRSLWCAALELPVRQFAAYLLKQLAFAGGFCQAPWNL